MRAGSLTPWRPTRPPGDNPGMFATEVRMGERAMLTTKDPARQTATGTRNISRKDAKAAKVEKW